MKIVFCIDRYQPTRGGAERYLRDLGAALLAKGHAVSFASLEAEDDGLGEKLRIPCRSSPRLFREIAFALHVSRIKREGRYDRVVGFRHVLDVDRYQPHEGLFRDSLMGALRSTAARSTIRRALFLKKLLSPKNLFFLYADRALFRRNPGLKVAALSEMTARSILKRYGRWKPEVRVIPNGVDRKRFQPIDAETPRGAVRARLDIPSQSRVILFAAHNFRLKGLIEALKGVAEYKSRGASPFLLVVGQGKAEKYVKPIRRMNLEGCVRFLGGSDDMPKLYREADLLLHPTFYDPCSLVVLEALGSGIPVITTRFNGAAELMADSQAGLVLDDPRNSRSLADAMQEILDKGQYETFRSEAARIGCDNDFASHVERIDQWIQAV